MGSCGMSLMGCLMLLVGVITLSKSAEAGTHVVGDDELWNVPSYTNFYTDWVANKTFAVGDILNFTWTGTHDVAETTKTQYDNCQAPATIKLSSSGNVNLTEAGSKYYICTIGNHCTQGQKLAITVTASNSSTPSTPSTSPPPPPSSTSPPPPPPSSSSVSSVSVDALLAATSVLLVYFLA